MNKKIFISVVIITYNKIDYFKSVMMNLENQTKLSDIEYIVINDGSTDDTKEYLESYNGSLNFKYLSLPDNLGSSIARNNGIKLAKGEFILFIDNDIILAPDYLEKLSSSLKKFPNRVHSGRLRLIPLAVVPSIIQEIHNTGKVSMERLIKNSYLDAIYGTLQKVYSHSVDVDIACWWGIVSGGNICFPRTILEEAGFFDETFKSWGPEDIDLCYRAFKKHYLLKYNSQCRLFHLDHERNNKEINNTMVKHGLQLYKKYDKSKEILSYLNFFNGVISFQEFNNVCSEFLEIDSNIKLNDYYLSLEFYIKKNQIINWKKK